MLIHHGLLLLSLCISLFFFEFLDSSNLLLDNHESIKDIDQDNSSIVAVTPLFDKNEISTDNEQSLPLTPVTPLLLIKFNESVVIQKGKIKKINHDPDYALVIDEGISQFYQTLSKEFQQNFPIDISHVVASFIYDKPFNDLYDKVMNALEIPKAKIHLDFHDENFLNQLYPFLLSGKKKFSRSDIFWYDLERLVFKWALFMRQKFANLLISNENDKNETKNENENNQLASRWNSISSNIESIIFLIRISSPPTFSNDFDLECMDRNSFVVFKLLINCEILEHSSIINSFNLILDDFYNRKFDCNQIKIKYFNGNFKSDLLLSFTIVFYDSVGGLREACFSNGDYSELSFSPFNPPMESSFSNLVNSKLNSSDDYFEISVMSYISDSIMESFLLYNKRFLILNSFKLSILLNRFNDKWKILLKSKSLNEIIEFEFKINGINSRQWNEGIFKKFLKEAKNENYISESNYYFYLNLIN